MHVAVYGITGPRTEVHEILGIHFDWPDPQSCQISWRPDKKCAKYPLWRNFAPQKSRPKFTLGRYQICHQSIGRRLHEFLYTLCSNVGSRRLRFRYIAGFVSQLPILHIPLIFHPRFGDVPWWKMLTSISGTFDIIFTEEMETDIFGVPFL